MKYYFIIFFSIILISCAGTQETKKETFSDKLNGRQKDLHTLTASGSVIMNYPEGSNSGRFKLTAAGADSLLFEIYGPFGISIGKLFARKDYFLMLNSFSAEAFEGIPDEESLSKALQMPVSFSELIRLFRNETPGEPGDFEIHSQNAEIKDLLFKNGKTPGYAEFVLYSPDQGGIVQYQKKIESKGMVLNARFSEFDDFEGYRLPKKIKMFFPEPEGSITFDIDNYSINEENGAFSFSLPSSIKPVRIQRD